MKFPITIDTYLKLQKKYFDYDLSEREYAEQLELEGIPYFKVKELEDLIHHEPSNIQIASEEYFFRDNKYLIMNWGDRVSSQYLLCQDFSQGEGNYHAIHSSNCFISCLGKITGQGSGIIYAIYLDFFRDDLNDFLNSDNYQKRMIEEDAFQFFDRKVLSIVYQELEEINSEIYLRQRQKNNGKSKKEYLGYQKRTPYTNSWNKWEIESLLR